MKRFFLLPLVSAFLFSSYAHAHHIWIEQKKQSANLYFGEFMENLRETSPGLLDKFVNPTATLYGNKGERKLSLKKINNAFILSAHAGKNETILVEETSFPIRERHGSKVWTTFGARLVTSDASVDPKLTLDIVPTNKKGQFKVTFRDQPLQKAKVEILTPSGWVKEGWTNEQGLVSFDQPWRGIYVVEVRYIDKTPGYRNGDAYDVARFVSTLSLNNLKGIKALPALPAAKPKSA